MKILQLIVFSVLFSSIFHGEATLAAVLKDLKEAQDKTSTQVIFQCNDKSYGLSALQGLVLKSWQSIDNFSGDEQIADYSTCQFTKEVKSVYISVRSKGSRLGHRWSSRPKNVMSLVDFITKFKTRLGTKKVKKVQMVELHFTYNYLPVKYGKGGNSQILHIQDLQGMIGLELRHNNKPTRYPASYSIVRNKKHHEIIKEYLIKRKLTQRNLGNEVSVNTFEADKYLIKLGRTPEIHQLYRADKLVPVESVSKDNTEKWIERSSDWMLNNVHEGGRLTYLFYPSQHKEASGKNNMIRQWMATVALGRIARYSYSAFAEDIAEKNIDYNLSRFYQEDKETGLGYIYFRKKSKLGSNALAVLSIMEHPKREKWRRQELAIRKTIRSLWNEDGSFTTFYKPEGRNDQQQFYPGEALYLWGFLYKENQDPELYKMFMKSFNYYRDWHLVPRNRNPAFVPWHTEAYYTMWQITKNPEFVDFIFKMNDWLVDVEQQWGDEIPYKDAWGRFYEPSNKYGPAHASATGVYLEGLIDAYSLAKAVKDNKRKEKYRQAIIRGIRSMMQLQYKDPIDMFYIPRSKKNYVYGGIRETVYKNHIRCDNVQHALMGILKVVEEFKPEDYLHVDDDF